VKAIVQGVAVATAVEVAVAAKVETAVAVLLAVPDPLPWRSVDLPSLCGWLSLTLS
jgi:hypothetical protein